MPCQRQDFWKSPSTNGVFGGCCTQILPPQNVCTQMLPPLKVLAIKFFCPPPPSDCSVTSPSPLPAIKNDPSLIIYGVALANALQLWLGSVPPLTWLKCWPSTLIFGMLVNIGLEYAGIVGQMLKIVFWHHCLLSLNLLWGQMSRFKVLRSMSSNRVTCLAQSGRC